MKKYINPITISLLATTCLFIAGNAFALRFKSKEHQMKFCETIKEQMVKVIKEIKSLENDKNNIDNKKLENLRTKYEKLKSDLDQASCDFTVFDENL